MSSPAPPAELTPDTFAARLYAALEPLTRQDADFAWSLLIYVNAIGAMFQLVEDLVRDTADGPGWSPLLDLDRCPDEALPWLAQFAGVRVLPGSSPDDQRARIASTDGFRRGTVAALRGAAAATLTGQQKLLVYERSGDTAVSPEYAYYLRVRSYTSETPNPAATLSALLSQKPGGLVLDYAAVAGQDYAQLKAGHASYAAVKAAYVNYSTVAADQPG